MTCREYLSKDVHLLSFFRTIPYPVSRIRVFTKLLHESREWPSCWLARSSTSFKRLPVTPVHLLVRLFVRCSWHEYRELLLPGRR